ncbi:membrane protein [Shewanella sp. NFH-SH190041]|nr:membrane protein [Shewanella sp. NFH-SH190041]
MIITLWLMFSGAFLAATLLPGGSEILLAVLVEEAPLHWPALLAAAALGNTLGSLTSFYLGRLGRFAKTPEAMSHGRYRHALALVQRYGIWSLLLAWAPIIGDLLCLLAGWLKLPLWPSTAMILLGKTLRYVLIIAAVLHWGY